MSSPPLESGARIEYGLKNWNWNDSHGFASGASVILDIKILVKKLWRGKDLLLTRWACTEMINLILKSRTKEWRKSDVRATVKRNNNINWNVCKNIKLGGTLPSHTDIFAANQRHIISWRNHCQPLYLIFCDYLIISAYLKLRPMNILLANIHRVYFHRFNPGCRAATAMFRILQFYNNIMFMGLIRYRAAIEPNIRTQNCVRAISKIHLFFPSALAVCCEWQNN